MKLRNKKTWKVKDVWIEASYDSYPSSSKGITVGAGNILTTNNIRHYDSLAELNEEWEDYSKPEIKHKKGFIAWLKKRGIKLIISILLGVLIAGLVHMILENSRVRNRAESLCTLFDKDSQSVCRHGVNTILDMADEDFENYIQSKGY